MKTRNPDLTDGRRDAFLARFLFARKLDVTRALEMLKNHIAWREKFKIDTDFDPQRFRPFFQSGMTLWSPMAKDRQGRAVSYLLPRNVNPKLFEDLHAYVQYSYYCTDVMLDSDISFMREGMIIIEDFNGTNFKTFSSMMGKADMKEMFNNVQDNIPARIRGIFLLDPPWYVRFLIALVKPFMKQKMKKKITCLSSSELTKYVAEENLLQEYGGTLQFDYFAWVEELMQKRPGLSEGKFFNLGDQEQPTKKKKKKKAEITDDHNE